MRWVTAGDQTTLDAMIHALGEGIKVWKVFSSSPNLALEVDLLLVCFMSVEIIKQLRLEAVTSSCK
jgi:hypothetical protein